jgi:hypothetical protein
MASLATPGLLYQDLLIETPEVSEAIRRMPPFQQEMRLRRLKIGMLLLCCDATTATTTLVLTKINSHFQLLPCCRCRCGWLCGVANDCAIKQTPLPESQHTKPEEDVPYLTPYLHEVSQEFADREAFRV